MFTQLDAWAHITNFDEYSNILLSSKSRQIHLCKNSLEVCITEGCFKQHVDQEILHIWQVLVFYILTYLGHISNIESNKNRSVCYRKDLL